MMGRLISLVLLGALCAAVASPAKAEKRVSLVIGNSAYQHAPTLKNPKSDATAMAALLARSGFDVVEGIDVTYADMRRKLRDFAYKLEGADVGLLFYAGHGLQVHGRNYLAPVDAQLKKEVDLEFEAMRLETILSHMEQATKTNIVFLDACRDNPLARNLARSMGTRSAAIGRGLARVDMGVGTMIAFATQPGNVAFDGDGANSPFTAGLLKHIETPGLDVALAMRRVRQEVIDATKGQQVPWDNSSLTGSFVLKAKAEEPKPEPVVQAPATTRQDGQAIELAFWQAAQDTDSGRAYQLYLEKYPQGAFAGLAKMKLEALAKAEAEAKKKAEEPIKPVAALPAPVPAEATRTDSPDPQMLTYMLQAELKRVGCHPGDVDGKWGTGSRGALADFNRYAKLRLPTGAPTVEAIDAVKAKTSDVCPAPKPKTQTVTKPEPKRQAASDAPTRRSTDTSERLRAERRQRCLETLWPAGRAISDQIGQQCK